MDKKMKKFKWILGEFDQHRRSYYDRVDLVNEVYWDRGKSLEAAGRAIGMSGMTAKKYLWSKEQWTLRRNALKSID